MLQTKLDTEQRDYVENILYSATRLLALVRDVLDISKIEAGFMKINNATFDLHNLLDKQLKSFTSDAKYVF